MDFYNYSNEISCPIIYDYTSTNTNLNDVLSKFTTVDRISFVFDELLLNNKNFIDKKRFFVDEDLIETDANKLSGNFKLLVDTIKRLTVKNVDFLACNSLNYPKWKSFYNKLMDLTNVKVGASNDKTGNLKFGGDWVLESTDEDVKAIYFTNDISKYAYTLAINDINLYSGQTVYFRQDGDLIEYQIDSTSGNWTSINDFPIQIINTDNPYVASMANVVLNSELTFTNENAYFMCGSQYITFDGRNHNVNINGISGYPGLIQNGTLQGNGYSNITIRNINLNVNGSLLINYGGWIGQQYFCKSGSDILIENCSSNGAISLFAGGILGANCASNGTVTITNCYSTGTIGSLAGGIFGQNCAQNSGNATATNCYSLGDIGQLAGGIFGNNYQNSTATHCYASGKSSYVVQNHYAGGIYSNSSSDGSGNYSEANNGNSGVWNSHNTINILKNVSTTVDDETTWLNYDPSGNTPFILYGFNGTSVDTSTYFNNNFYNDETSTKTTVSVYTDLPLSDIHSNNFLIVPPTDVDIDSSGQMMSSVAGEYILTIVNYNEDINNNFYGYNTITFTLTVNPASVPAPNTFNLSVFYSNSARKKTEKKIKKYINDL